MQPKGSCQYVFDSVSNVWVPWEGTVAGFGGVTLFTTAGQAIDTPTGLSDGFVTAHLLGVAGFNYGFNRVGNVWDRTQSYSNTADALGTDGGNASNLSVTGLNYGFNGSTFDRIRSFAGNADNITSPTLGLLGIGAFRFVYDGTNWDRARSLVDNADDVAVNTIGLTGAVARLTAFDGTTYDRLRTGSVANLSAANTPAPLLATLPGEWAINHTPAANTQATITRAAGAAGVRHVCKSITVSLIGLVTAVEATVLVNLRDGASGAGTILWSTRLFVSVSTQTGVTLDNLNIIGSDATAMTLEFAAAGGANTFEAVAATGFDAA